MAKGFFLCIVCLAASGASAQLNVGSVGMNGPNYTTTSVIPGMLGGRSETPTMREEKLVRAISLRHEADTLLAQDNGKFTPEHEAYIRRKVCDILEPKTYLSGRLVQPRRCRS